MKKLDLNIERILENWDVEDAIRELIANAIDETLLTQTTGIEILPTGNNWSIRDYGRGIKPSDFTQNENSVKIKHPSAFGKFGVGYSR